jgi:hypothetical protein
MALLFMDSFDHYAQADALDKWSTISPTTSRYAANLTPGAGRRGSAGLRVVPEWTDFQVGWTKALPTTDITAVMGFALRLSNVPTSQSSLIQILNGSLPQVTFRYNNNGTMTVLRGNMGGTILATSAVALPLNADMYVEIKAVLHTANGSIEFRVNGTSILTLTSLNTANTGAPGWTGFVLGHVNGGPFVSNNPFNQDYDDLYVLDGGGAAPWNSFLGDCRVDAQMPTAPGANSGWTPSAGANWSCVDDTTPNDDTDYTQAATVDLTDTFVVPDVPTAGSRVYGVQHCINAKKSDAGVSAIAPVVRQSGTDAVGTSIGLGSTYRYALQVQQTNPATGAQWTEAEFNAAEFGYKRTA